MVAVGAEVDPVHQAGHPGSWPSAERSPRGLEDDDDETRSGMATFRLDGRLLSSRLSPILVLSGIKLN